MKNNVPLIGYFLVFSLSTLNSAVGQDFPNRVTAPLGKSLTGDNEDFQERFLRQEWSPGIVQFKNTKTVMQVPVIFDIENNMLYYLEKNVIMEFVDSISQFMIKAVRNGDSTFITFRNSYPLLQSNTNQTFYEVLVDGNFQLLKCRAKSIYRFKEPDILDKKRSTPRELLFAYIVPDNQIVTIKKDISSVVDKMPKYAQRIREIEEKHNLKIKNEKKLSELFTYLNKSD